MQHRLESRQRPTFRATRQKLGASRPGGLTISLPVVDSGGNASGGKGAGRGEGGVAASPPSPTTPLALTTLGSCPPPHALLHPSSLHPGSQSAELVISLLTPHPLDAAPRPQPPQPVGTSSSLPPSPPRSQLQQKRVALGLALKRHTCIYIHACTYTHVHGGLSPQRVDHQPSRARRRARRRARLQARQPSQRRPTRGQR